jgi:tetratricopeptide (TPR) repeat protein
LWLAGGGAIFALAAVLLMGNRWLARMAIEHARREMAAQHVEEAIEWLDWSLKWHAGSAETELLLSRAYRKRGKFEECREHLNRAHSLGMSDDRYRRELVLVRAQKGEIPAHEMNKQLAVLLSDPNGDAAEITESFANGYLVNQRYTEAMRLLDAWHLDFPDDAQPHYMRGIIWEYLGSLEAAENEFRRALELQPTHYPAAMALGNFLVKRRRVEESLSFFELCAEATFEGPAARVSAARCLRLLGKLAEARSRIEQVLADDPDLLAARIELAHLDIAVGQYDRAIPWLRRAVKERPSDTDARFALATALAACGQRDEARQHFDFVNKARPAVARARELIVGLTDDPDNVDARAEIGRLLLQYGSEGEGMFWLGTALSIDANCKPAHEALADYFDQQADRDPEAAARAIHHRRLAQADAANHADGTSESTGAAHGCADTPAQSSSEARAALRGDAGDGDATDR